MSRFHLVADSTSTLPVVVPLNGETLEAAVRDVTSEKNGWLLPTFIIDFDERKAYRVHSGDDISEKVLYDNAAEFWGPATKAAPWVEVSLAETGRANSTNEVQQ